MITFIHGSDRGFILLKTIIAMFLVFLILISILELEYRKYVQARKEYENIQMQYEQNQEVKSDAYSIRRF